MKAQYDFKIGFNNSHWSLPNLAFNNFHLLYSFGFYLLNFYIEFFIFFNDRHFKIDE